MGHEDCVLHVKWELKCEHSFEDIHLFLQCIDVLEFLKFPVGLLKPSALIMFLKPLKLLMKAITGKHPL